MPAILLELITFFKEAKKAESLLKFLEKQGKVFLGSKVSKVKNAIKQLSPSEALEFRKKIGPKVHDHINKQLGLGENSSIRVDTPSSSWVQYLEWDNKTKSGKLKTKKSPKVYTLPFFPREIITMVQRGASAGKTIWRKYWRVVGKGSVANKTKNYKAVTKAKRKVNFGNKFRGFQINTKTGKIQRKRRAYVRTSTIKNTGATGVRVTIVKPKIKRK